MLANVLILIVQGIREKLRRQGVDQNQSILFSLLPRFERGYGIMNIFLNDALAFCHYFLS